MILPFLLMLADPTAADRALAEAMHTAEAAQQQSELNNVYATAQEAGTEAALQQDGEVLRDMLRQTHVCAIEHANKWVDLDETADAIARTAMGLCHYFNNKVRETMRKMMLRGSSIPSETGEEMADDLWRDKEREIKTKVAAHVMDRRIRK